MQQGTNQVVSVTITAEMKARSREATLQQQEAIARTLKNGTKSGIFVDDPQKRPMPLSTKRSIPFPRLNFRAPRRTTSGDSVLSRGSTHSIRSTSTKGTFGAPSSAWVCERCGHSNDDSENQSCALCGIVQKEYRISTLSRPVVSDDDESSNREKESITSASSQIERPRTAMETTHVRPVNPFASNYKEFHSTVSTPSTVSMEANPFDMFDVSTPLAAGTPRSVGDVASPQYLRDDRTDTPIYRVAPRASRRGSESASGVADAASLAPKRKGGELCGSFQ